MITDEQPPVTTEKILSEYLIRQFRAGKLEDEDSDKITEYTAIPAKLRVGKIYYFNNAIPSDAVITAEGFYGYKSTGWVLLG